MTQIATVTPVIQNITITTPSETVTIQSHVRDNVTISTDTLFVAPPGGTGTVTQVDTGTGLTGGPITTTGTVALDPLSSNPSGNYQHATILVDAYGRVTAASSGTDNQGVTSVLGGNHLNQVTNGSVVTVNHDSPGAQLSSSQFVESIAVDAYGHVTGVTESADQAAAQTFLGLGNAATKTVGTTTGTVAAGDDARFTDARAPLAHSATLITSGTLAVAQGGTGSATAPMVGVITAADATAARTALGAAGSNHSHTLGNITDAGTAAALDAGITSNDVLQVATSGVTANEFLRLEALGTKVISRTAAETLSDIGAAAAAHTHQDSYAMFITAPADKASPGYVVDARVASARTITNFYAKTESGSCVATLRNITDNVEIASVTADSTGASDASLLNTAVTENERIGVVISSNSSAVDLQIVVEYTS